MFNADIGIIVQLSNVLENGVEDILELGLNACQINCWNAELYTVENAEKLKEIVKDKVKITAYGQVGPHLQYGTLLTDLLHWAWFHVNIVHNV